MDAKVKAAIDMYEYGNQGDVEKALEGAEVLFSCYETGSYEGGWMLVYIDKDGKLMYDMGSHCSCNGPSFSPSPTTPEGLMQKEPYLVSLDDLRAALRARFPATLAPRKEVSDADG